MKKIAPIAALALLAVAFTSCKKDYTCSCSDSTGDKQEIEIKDAKKKDAKAACDGWSTIWALSDNGSCSLK